MQIGRIAIRNFRCLEEISVDFGNLTSLVGANNAGKSTILKAIDIFFQPSPKISIEDHFRHELTKKISILIEFINLTPRERDQFSSAVVSGKLRVQRELSADGTEGGEYSVYAAVYPEFQAYRDETNGTKRRSIYAELRRAYGLPAVSPDQMDAQLAEWEAQHPEALVVMPVRGFFGARNVAAGKLAAKTSVRLVPAVKETGEELRDPRKSVSLR